ncbi:YfaP family protein [Venatoribacter cucullus]|uniref:YfaP family protein n=1 Tax=Venatoribacter cucullus TaxID=2661630 RepID=UPI00223FF0FC|nr:hypothetical protein [Venatoribacter cucullus]UZK02910.1 hypothetical protein GAY96_02800 [Venatoribacter cucullus]
MTYQKHLLAVAIAASLAACGGSSGGSSSDATPPPAATQVTADNLAQALSIQGAEPVTVDIPENLSSSSGLTSGTDSVVVSANSAFTLNLAVPVSEVPDGKQVAGYVVELPGGSQQFVRVDSNTTSGASVQSVTVPVKQLADGDAKVKTKTVKTPRPARVQAAGDDAVGATSVTITGWNPANFNLDASLEGLVLRIIPLFVNENITDIATRTFAELQAADGFAISLVQELALAVEAVATSPVQISLTWDTQTDVDLYVLEPDSDSDQNVIYYLNPISATSLGWLDTDNTTAYGPENITYGYEVPPGTYHVGVNYYSGAPETKYSITVAIGSDVQTFTGTFEAGSRNYGDMSGLLNPDGSIVANETNTGSDIVFSFTADQVNSLLAAKVPNSQYLGVYQLPEDSSVQGYIKIENDRITAYELRDSSCYYFYGLTTNYLPTGFRVNSGLQVSDAFRGGFIAYEEESAGYTYAYRTLTKVADSVLSDCLGYEEVLR